jgi:hypothetical protein
MNSSFSIHAILIALVCFFSGSGGRGIDLLDTITTDAYWQVKGVTVSVEQLQADADQDKSPENVEGLLRQLGSGEFAVREKARRDLERMGPAILPQLRPAMNGGDPEVASVASGLVKQFTERAQERSIRRLMAIRTLGERKEQAALPLLRSLAASKELFVSDYALRAVAQVEGKQIESIGRRKEFEKDLSMMPRDFGIVGQVIAWEGGESITITGLINEIVDSMKGGGVGPMRGAGAGGGGQEQPVDKKKLEVNATRRLLMLLECTGNLRLEGATVGVSKDVGENSGSAVVLLRGKYNPVAVREAIRLASGRTATTQPGAGDAREILDNEVTALFPSEDLFILAFGAMEQRRDAVADLVLSSLRSGKGTLEENAPLAGLIQGVKKTGPVWVAAVTPEAMKKESLFAGIDTFTMESTRNADTFQFRFAGTGEDGEKLKASVTAWEDGIKQAQRMVGQQAQGDPQLAVVAELMNSLKLTSEAGRAQLSGEMKTSIRRALLESMGTGLLMMTLGEEMREGVGQDRMRIGE